MSDDTLIEIIHDMLIAASAVTCYAIAIALIVAS